MRSLRNRAAGRTLATVAAGNEEAARPLERVIRYNVGMMSTVSRDRMEHLISLCCHVHALDRSSCRVLCIGPRNDSELLLLRAYGFADVTAIDLFSNSPHILPMDMHAMTFADGTFDLLFASYVIAYSHDRPKASAEMARVLKSGGVLALSFVYQDKDQNVVGLQPIRGGLQELFGWFNGLIDQVHWQEVVGRDCSTIFSIRTPGAHGGLYAV